MNEKTILLTNAYKGEPLRILLQSLPAGFRVVTVDPAAEDPFAGVIENADYLLAGGRLKITEEVLARAHRLKMIQRSGVGLDSLDLKAIEKAGIPLYVNRGVNAESVAEHALLLILACLRRLPEIHENTVSGIWKKQEQGISTRELHGKTVGLVGMGAIAQTLVRLLRPFGVRIVYFDVRRAPDAFEKENGLSFLPLAEVLGEADILSLHCALTPQTVGMISRGSIEKMKDGAILVNTARGGLVNAADLADALDSGKIAYAALDVHEAEPIPANSPELQMKHVILTPHIGGVTADSFSEMMRAAMHNIEKFDKGESADIEDCRWRES